MRLTFAFVPLLAALMAACGGNNSTEQKTTVTESEQNFQSTPPFTEGNQTGIDLADKAYIRLNVGGVEKVLLAAPPDKCARCNDYEIKEDGRTFLRVERFDADNLSESFAWQLHNFDLTAADTFPVILKADPSADPPTLTHVLYKKSEGDKKTVYEAKNKFVFTITGIKDGWYSGTFEGEIVEKGRTLTEGVFVTTGDFNLRLNVLDLREKPAM
ncbi:MAG: hypothetical protein ACFCUI_13155 [Bernardetiaceae bacterium]